jgi:catechol 2,3-dioxygenase
MLPPATHPGAVRLQVADLARSLAFYEGVLGLRVHEQHAGAAVLGAAGGASIVELVERAGARRPPRAGLLGLFHVAYLLPDRAALGRFLRHVASLGIPTGMSDHLVSEAIYLSDPDGLGVEVYADRPRASWRFSGRQLVMATEPLDAHGLLAAAGDAPWAGAPPGTTVGHVHLHVGDLEEASAFYGDALGLEPTVWDYPGALFLSAGGYHHHLGLNTWASGSPPAGPDDARLLDWELVLPTPADALAASDRLAAAGHSVVREGAGWLADDPWGTRVRLTG